MGERMGSLGERELCRSAQRAMAETGEGAPLPGATFPFVEVTGPDGKKKRFAKGTRASYAVERFNKLIPNDSKPVVCIQAYKEGEEPIEYGPDVELLLYDQAWTLQSVSEYVFPIPDVNAEPGVETIETQTVEKELYKRSSSSQAPWEINEDVAKTLLDRRTPADGDVRPGTRMATPIPVHRASAITWTELMINTLLDVYEEKYFLVERGNLKKRHWKDIVTEFNHKSGLVLAKENLRSKLDNLKKKYKLETELIANASGGIRSSWNMYDRCDILWGCTPKRGLPGERPFRLCVRDRRH